MEKKEKFDFNDKCNADVAFETPIAYFAPVNFAKSDSNLRNCGPSVSKVFCRALIAVLRSCFDMVGTKNGTLILELSNASNFFIFT